MTQPHFTSPKVRLTEQELNELKKQLPSPYVGQDTTAHQAGFLLGIQFVLQRLELGWVIKS